MNHLKLGIDIVNLTPLGVNWQSVYHAYDGLIEIHDINTDELIPF